MPKRKPFLKGYHYHCFNRGLNKQKIFLDDSDYKFFLELFRLYNRKYNHVKILEVSLLPNHFHFVMKSLAYGYHISRFFERLSGHYAKYFVFKYGYPKCTSIFEGRFKSILIDTNSYLSSCIYYVTLNPIKHGYIQNIDKRPYRYSSDNITNNTIPHISILEKWEKSQDLKGKLEN